VRGHEPTELAKGFANDPVAGRAMKTILWWLCLLVAPALLIAIELFHPAGFTANPGMYQFLSKPEPYQPQFQALGYFGPSWWFTLHMIQTPVVGLVAVGLWLLTDGIHDRVSAAPAVALAWLSRVATLVFLIYYTVLDGIGGIGLGRTILTAQNLTATGQLSTQQMDGIVLLLNTIWTDPWIGGVGSFVSQTGSWAVFAAALFAAASLLLSRSAPWPPLILLIAFGWELQTSHASPHGPIAFALLIVAALWLWLTRHRTKS
jgi:hypothetical protein